MCPHLWSNPAGLWRKNRKNALKVLNVTSVRGSNVLWVCFAAGGTGALHKMDGLMRKLYYVEIVKGATSKDISKNVQ